VGREGKVLKRKKPAASRNRSRRMLCSFLCFDPRKEFLILRENRPF
jgi:hypothetical protein